MTIYLTLSNGAIIGTPHTTREEAKTASNGHGEVVEMVEASLSFHDMLEKAAKELPKWWEIEVSVEKGAGRVSLIGPDGEYVDFPSNYERIEDEFLDALEYAKSKELEGV